MELPCSDDNIFCTLGWCVFSVITINWKKMYEIIFDWPIYILLPVFIIIFNLIGLGFLLMVRKFQIYPIISKSNEFVLETYSDAIGIIFAFVLSLVTVTAWQTHNDISNSVAKEATTLFNIYRTLDSYPPEIRERGREELRDFIYEVINSEWPSMKKGQYDTKASLKFLNFGNLVGQYKPKDYAELAAQQEELRLLSNYRELRGIRIENTKPLIDNNLLLILSLSAMVYLFYQSLYKMIQLRVHLIMYLALTTSIGLVFIMILIFNNPFIGPSAISPEPFQKLLNYYWPLIH
jgi:hypothetical protein